MGAVSASNPLSLPDSPCFSAVCLSFPGYRKPVSPAGCPRARVVQGDTLRSVRGQKDIDVLRLQSLVGPVGSQELLRGALWRLFCHHPSLKGLITQASPSLGTYCLGPQLQRHFLTGHQHGYSL